MRGFNNFWGKKIHRFDIESLKRLPKQFMNMQYKELLHAKYWRLSVLIKLVLIPAIIYLLFCLYLWGISFAPQLCFVCLSYFSHPSGSYRIFDTELYGSGSRYNVKKSQFGIKKMKKIKIYIQNQFNIKCLMFDVCEKMYSNICYPSNNSIRIR